MNGRVIRFEGSVHAEMDRFLPWWVNGTLSEEECAEVERHVAECAACQREAAWLRGLKHAYEEEETRSVDVARAMRRLRRQVAGGKARATMPPLPAFAGPYRDRWLGWVVAAQAVLVVALGFAWLHGLAPAYRTLSTSAIKNSALIVVFEPQISEAQLRQLLRANHARIVGGPSETGAYLLSVPSDTATAAHRRLHEAKEVILVENLDTGGNP